MPDETQAGAAPAEQVPATIGIPQQAPSPTQVSPDLEALVDARLEKFSEGLAKRLRQSQTDVIEDRLTKMLNRHFGQPAQAPQPTPGSPAPAAPPQAQPAEQVSSVSGLDQEIKGILTDNGLTGAEPELAELLKSKQGQPWYRVGPEFAQLAATIAARNTGSPAGVVAPPGATPPGPNLAQQYVDEVAAARAAGRFGAAELRKIKEKYRARKLDVDNIRFEIPGVPVIARGKTDGLK